MNGLAFKQLKQSQLPATLNLCADSPEFALKINRALEWLLTCGSFEGTTRLAEFCLEERCFVTPGCVQNVEAIRISHHAARIENDWYRFLPGFNPCEWETGDLWFEYRDQVPSMRSLCRARVLRAYASHPLDYGKTIKFLGYDSNRIWVRTLQSGVMADGEVVTLATPFAETVTEFFERDGCAQGRDKRRGSRILAASRRQHTNAIRGVRVLGNFAIVPAL